MEVLKLLAKRGELVELVDKVCLCARTRMFVLCVHASEHAVCVD